MERKRFTLDDYNKKESFKDATKFFIVYEGEDKEPKYFGTFNNLFFEPKKASILHVFEKDTNVVGSQPKKLIERAKSFIENPPKDLPVTPSAEDKFRFVLDVDQHPPEEYPELKAYCESLVDANLFISNYCFEIWLLFHLDERENIQCTTSKESKTELGEKHTTSKIKNYPKGYLTPDLILKAIERAEKADINKDSYFPAVKSTKVYLLMKELLRYSLINKEVIEPQAP
ncbi:RloB family protein [Flavobacterium ginsengiterrae]|uniref:RloB-like protein n=1 Tax=Flavobacterium ginsengiterrae TaxID=871695 RepID=A0ABP7GH69_9FLAO